MQISAVRHNYPGPATVTAASKTSDGGWQRDALLKRTVPSFAATHLSDVSNNSSILSATCLPLSAISAHPQAAGQGISVGMTRSIKWKPTLSKCPSTASHLFKTAYSKENINVGGRKTAFEEACSKRGRLLWAVARACECEDSSLLHPVLLGPISICIHSWRRVPILHYLYRHQCNLY